MKKVIGIALFAIVGICYSFTANKINDEPEVGIKFEHFTLEDAKAKAKKSGKLIFVDCYTSWCGPCKIMARTAFVDQKVGEIFNDQFINLKVEMEKDADGPEMARLYKIQAYPTLLVIDSNGKIVKQLVGGRTAEQLLALASSVED